jgi:hypothetical protein
MSEANHESEAKLLPVVVAIFGCCVIIIVGSYFIGNALL